MDTFELQQRNYRMVENLRQQNRREQRRLLDRVHQDIGGHHRAELAEINHEQKKIKKELAIIKQSSTSSLISTDNFNVSNNSIAIENNGANPHYATGSWRRGTRPSYAKRGHFGMSQRVIDDINKNNKNSMMRVQKIPPSVQQKNEEYMKQTRMRLQKFNKSYPIENEALSSNTPISNSDLTSQSSSNKSGSIGDVSLTDARDLAAKRLLGVWKNSEQKQEKLIPSPRRLLTPLEDKQTRETHDEDQNSVYKWRDVAHKATKVKSTTEHDPHYHNPDGSVRTMHTLPDFNESLKEAMRARYLRLTFKPWYESEMTMSEMFPKKKTNIHTYGLNE